MFNRPVFLALIPVILGFGGCPGSVRETGDADTHDGCAPVEAACLEYGASFYQYWTLPEQCSGGWSSVAQCEGDDCADVEVVSRQRDDFTDISAACSDGYSEIVGEVCWSCPETAPEPAILWAPAAPCGPDHAEDGWVEVFVLPTGATAIEVRVSGVLPLGGNDYEAVSRQHEGWTQVGTEVRITCPTDLYDDRYRVGYR